MKTIRKTPRRQIFVFTPEEKKAAACVLAAFVLGLVTMHYRAAHPPTTVTLTPKQEYAAKKAARASHAQARSARGKATVAVAKVPPQPSSETSDDE